MKNTTASTVPQESDELLIAQAQAGDQDAMSELLTRHAPMLRRVALRYTGNPADAEDVMQEAMLKATLHIQRFRSEARFSTWIAIIAINVARGEQRITRKRHFVSVDEMTQDEEKPVSFQLADTRPDPEAELMLRNHCHMLRRALTSIPHKYRTILQYRDLDELSLEQTASHLGISTSAAKSRLHRGRLKLYEAARRQRLVHRHFLPQNEGAAQTSTAA